MWPHPQQQGLCRRDKIEDLEPGGGLNYTLGLMSSLEQGLQKRTQERAGQRERWEGAVPLALGMDGPWPRERGGPSSRERRARAALWHSVCGEVSQQCQDVTEEVSV